MPNFFGDRQKMAEPGQMTTALGKSMALSYA
jgi:hypothetical protein